MKKIQDKYQRLVARVYAGDLGVNQSAEVAGLIGVAIAVTAGVVTQGPQIGTAIANFMTSKLA